MKQPSRAWTWLAVLCVYLYSTIVGERRVWRRTLPEEPHYDVELVGERGSKKNETLTDIETTPGVEDGNLTCSHLGGPSRSIEEMVYWYKIASDAQYTSPLAYHKRSNISRQYLTFEVDEAGWNNVRLSMETAVSIAIATGRILVLPPMQRLHMLNAKVDGEREKFSLSAFFPLEEMARATRALEVISFEEFLNTVVLTGQVGKDLFPPENITNWDVEKQHGRAKDPRNRLWPWMRRIATVLSWKPASCIGVIPSQAGAEHVGKLRQELLTYIQEFNELEHGDIPSDWQNDANYDRQRFYEMFAHRSNLCFYGAHRQNTKVLHIVGEEETGHRLLTPFYGLYLQDRRQDLIVKRRIRDYVRYQDRLQCAAARIVQAIRHRVRQRQSHNDAHRGQFSALHVRRGDFLEFSQTAANIRIKDIQRENLQGRIRPNTTIYISTDEDDMSFFEQLTKVYDVVLLKDFEHLLEGISPNFYGMVRFPSCTVLELPLLSHQLFSIF